MILSVSCGLNECCGCAIPFCEHLCHPPRPVLLEVKVMAKASDESGFRFIQPEK